MRPNFLLTPLPAQLAESIFNHDDMGCDATFYWVPQFDEWWVKLKISYQYLKIDELFKGIFPKFINVEDFINLIQEIKNKILKEFDYYFNAIWC